MRIRVPLMRTRVPIMRIRAPLMAAAGTVLAGIAAATARRYEAAILYDVAAGVRVEPFDAARAWA